MKNRVFLLARGGSLGLVAAMALMLGGCSSDSIWPTLAGDEGSGETVEIAPSPAEVDANPRLTDNPAQFQSTGTVVGQRVNQLRGELAQLQASVAQRDPRLAQLRAANQAASETYFGTVAAIGARLQAGTTPGNPLLIDQFNKAQSALDQIGSQVTQMNMLATQVAGDSSSARFLLDSARAAMTLSGGIDEDHRQLRIIQDNTSRLIVEIDRTMSDLTQDVARQTATLATERQNMTSLAAAIKVGDLTGGRLSQASGPAGAAMPAQPPGNRRPLVVVRFDRPDVAYERQLSGAIRKALQRRPEARFDVVAVTAGGSAAELAANAAGAQSSAAGIVRTLNQRGVAPDRISLASQANDEIAVNEVRVYVR